MDKSGETIEKSGETIKKSPHVPGIDREIIGSIKKSGESIEKRSAVVFSGAGGSSWTIYTGIYREKQRIDG
ncbi:hypothetical protein [Salibacterium qingdaonense]|uniref:Uncharacterized protein n=1 Tax=Salibacterium qingdaonense TaxID=266892 RepID=A0A1I4KYH0_9BACI|nr:hypothetical protein [Salibacterium qingdaonense]SFL83790.1 hypothetical protein SAMN04488054_10659 [Salibacterium qingdaonense]